MPGDSLSNLDVQFGGLDLQFGGSNNENNSTNFDFEQLLPAGFYWTGSINSWSIWSGERHGCLPDSGGADFGSSRSPPPPGGPAAPCAAHARKFHHLAPSKTCCSLQHWTDGPCWPCSPTGHTASLPPAAVRSVDTTWQSWSSTGWQSSQGAATIQLFQEQWSTHAGPHEGKHRSGPKSDWLDTAASPPQWAHPAAWPGARATRYRLCWTSSSCSRCSLG